MLRAGSSLWPSILNCNSSLFERRIEKILSFIAIDRFPLVVIPKSLPPIPNLIQKPLWSFRSSKSSNRPANEFSITLEFRIRTNNINFFIITAS